MITWPCGSLQNFEVSRSTLLDTWEVYICGLLFVYVDIHHKHCID